MNWKQILRTDLTTLLRRFVPPHRYHEQRGRVWRGPVYRYQVFWRRDLLAVTAQLESIVRCNAPLVQGLELAAWDAPRRKVQLVLQALHDDLASGRTLHEAMALRKRFFPRYYVDLIKTGEVAGSLHRAIASIQEHINIMTQRWSTVWGWTAYLATVAVVQLAIMLFLVTYVFPEFAEVLKDFGMAAPALFRLVMEAGAAVRQWLKPLPAALLAMVIILPRLILPYRMYAGAFGGQILKSLGARIPFVSRIIAKAELAHVATVMERLLAAGIPLNEALQDCTDLGLSSRRRRMLSNVKRRLEDGNSLTQAFKAERGMPDSFVTFVSVGESSGLLPESFGRLAELYHQQTVMSSKVALDVAGPCGVIALGILVMVLEVAVFLAMAGIANAISVSI